MRYDAGGTRPYDWFPLSSTDPVPGDGMDLGDVSRRWRDVADELERQAGAVRRLAQESENVGDTADELRKGSDDLATKLTGAVGRYRATAAALDEYLPHLLDAQSDSIDALRAAQDAHARLDAAQASVAAHATASPAPVVDPADPAGSAVATAAHDRAEAARTSSLASARSQADQASADLALARTRLAGACADRDAAAERAARAVIAACSGDPLRDSGFDKFQQWVHENADLIRAISDWASTIGSILALAALAVGWIPIIGQGLAAILGVLAGLATVIALIGHTMLALSGDGEWLDVALDVVGLATAGVGKVAAPALKSAVNGMKAAGKVREAADAAGPVLAGKIGPDGIAKLKAAGLDPFDVALKMATKKMVGPAKQAVKDALGISGNAVDKVRAATRSAWHAVDDGAAAVKTVQETASEMAKPLSQWPDVAGGLSSMKADAMTVFVKQNWVDAASDLTAKSVGELAKAATAGAKEVVSDVGSLGAVATAVKVVGAPAGVVAGAVAYSGYNAYEGVASPVNDVSDAVAQAFGADEGPHLPTLPSPADAVEAVWKKVAP